MESYTPTPRTKVVRHADRGLYDRKQIEAILDEGFVCHVGFAADGQPYVIPMAYGRAGDLLYLHGSAGNRMLRVLAEGAEVCVTVTLVDGIVMGRSAFRQSINYRCVIILGKARLLTETSEKMAGLRCLTNHVSPGRWEEVRKPNAKELASTNVVEIALNEVSAKVRSGPPLDPPEDFLWPVWAGVLPLHTRAGEPLPAAEMPPDVPPINASLVARFGTRS